jgi:hypothetical protein
MPNSSVLFAAPQKKFTGLCGQTSNQRRINGFILTCDNWVTRSDPASIPDEELVRYFRAPERQLSTRGGFQLMPRYFFNTRIGDELISDPEGEQLRNPDRAWEVARAMIRELLKTEGAERGLLQAVLEVTDESGETVLEFPFAEAILDFSKIPATKH